MHVPYIYTYRQLSVSSQVWGSLTLAPTREVHIGGLRYWVIPFDVHNSPQINSLSGVLNFCWCPGGGVLLYCMCMGSAILHQGVLAVIQAMWYHVCVTVLSSSFVPRPHPAHAKEKGSGVTTPNPWASSRSVERPIKLQSGGYWNNVEVRTSTSIIPLKAML